MTVEEALSAIRRVGTVENVDGVLKLRFPETAAIELQPAIDTVRGNKPKTLSLLAGPDPDPAAMAHASAVLKSAGIRLMVIEGKPTVGLWSHLDSPEVRRALRVFGSDQLPVRYIDGSGVPIRYKWTRMESDPVPLNLLAPMEKSPSAPWQVRDRMLKEMRWPSKPLPLADWRDGRKVGGNG